MNVYERWSVKSTGYLLVAVIGVMVAICIMPGMCPNTMNNLKPKEVELRYTKDGQRLRFQRVETFVFERRVYNETTTGVIYEDTKTGIKYLYIQKRYGVSMTRLWEK